jgi:anti-anti-sigma factor
LKARFHKADIHIHTNYSDGFHDPETVINFAVTQTDLSVIAITDHNTVDGAKHAYDYWQHHRAEFKNLEVIKGVEVSSNKGHILGLFVEEDIPAHMSPADTVRAIQEQGGLAIAAHPFTHLMKFSDLVGIGREIGELPLDAVEVRNSAPTELYANWITEQYNRRHRNHATIGGSDTHYLTMMGKTHTYFNGTTAEDLKQSVLNKQVQPGGHINGPGIVFQVFMHLIRRRKLPVFLPDDHHYRHTVPGLNVEVEEDRHTPIAIIHCAGELVRTTTSILEQGVDRLLAGGINKLVVDLADVSFVDSSGLGVLISAQKRAQSSNGNVVLSSPNEMVSNTLRLVRLDKVLRVFPSVETARSALLVPGE